MPELAFYRQKRYDQGIRMGIERDGSPLLEHFEEGLDPSYEGHPLASALLWYVDIRCTLPDAPTAADAARCWFLDHARPIVDGLSELADLVAAGFDDRRPLEWRIPPGASEGIETWIVCSCINRLTRLEIAAVFRDISTHWADCIRRLEAVTSSISD